MRKGHFPSLILLASTLLTACSPYLDTQHVTPVPRIHQPTPVRIELLPDTRNPDKVLLQLRELIASKLSDLLELQDQATDGFLLRVQVNDEYVCLDQCLHSKKRGFTWWFVEVQYSTPGEEPHLVALLHGNRDVFSPSAVELLVNQLRALLATHAV